MLIFCRNTHKTIVVLLIFICFSSCKDKREQEVEVVINNQSDFLIDTVKIYANYGFKDLNFGDSLVIKTDLLPDAIKTVVWQNPNLFQSDGDFYVRIKHLGYEFGYFSNGIILNHLDKYELKVYNDSIR